MCLIIYMKWGLDCHRLFEVPFMDFLNLKLAVLVCRRILFSLLDLFLCLSSSIWFADLGYRCLMNSDWQKNYLTGQEFLLRFFFNFIFYVCARACTWGGVCGAKLASCEYVILEHVMYPIVKEILPICMTYAIYSYGLLSWPKWVVTVVGPFVLL